MLSGIMVSQTYFYWSKYKQDRLWIKMLVYSIFCLETVHTVFSVHSLYSYLILEVEDILRLAYNVWSAGAILVVEMVVVALVQGFYIYRIWQLSRSVYVTVLPSFALFCRCALGIATAVLTYTFPTVVEFSTSKTVSVTLNFGLTLAVVVDILTSGLVIYYLLLQSAHIRQTKHIVHRLMFYTVNTGAISIIFSMLTLFTFNFVRFSFMFAGFVIISTKVYANSMLAMLNARNKLKRSNEKAVHSIPLTARRNSLGLGARTPPGNVVIEIANDTTADATHATIESSTSTVKVNEILC